MNEYDLFDAFGGIDRDLLERSEHNAVRKFPVRKLLIAAAAVMMMVVTVMAAPAIRALLFPSEPVMTSEGKRHIYGELYRSIDNAEYRIDLKIDSTAPLHSEIEEVRLPHYMIENDWLVSYGEIDAVYSEGPVHFKWWDRESPKWVTFEQLCIPSDGVSFKLETYHGAELQQKTLTFGDANIQYYNIPAYRNQETWESYPEATAVYWSDGEYAYHLECSSDVTEEELAQIVLSVGVVEDVNPYLKNDPDNDGLLIEMPPLDIHRMPTAIPDGYALKVCVDEDWLVRWIWENEEGCTIHFTEAHSNIYTDLFTAKSYQDYPDYSHEELLHAGTTIHSFRISGRHWLIWEDGSYCDALNVNIPFGHVYDLCWEGDEAVTLDDMLKITESVKEISDLSEYLTE